MDSLESETWPQDIYQVLVENRVRQVAYIPDSGIPICRTVFD